MISVCLDSEWHSYLSFGTHYEINICQLCFSSIHKCSTVFCRIHAPARTVKNPEGRLYSGIIISKSNDVRRLWRFPNLQFRFNGGKIAHLCVLNSLK